MAGWLQVDLEETPNTSIFVTDRFFLYPDSAHQRRSLVVWDVGRQRTLGNLVGHENDIDVVAAGGKLAVSTDGTDIRLWNLETLQCTATLPMPPSDGYVISSACCAEGSILLGHEDGTIKAWDVAASHIPPAEAALPGHAAEVHDIKTPGPSSPSIFLSGSGDRTVRLWDLRAGQCVRTMEGHAEAVWTVDMDGHCRVAVSGSQDRTVKVWDLGSGRCSDSHDGHDAQIGDVAMHESGSCFISLDYNGIVTGRPVGSAKPTMRADMAAFCLPCATLGRLFASRDLSKVALCCLGHSKVGLNIWR